LATSKSAGGRCGGALLTDGTGGRTGKRPAVFHGHGVASDAKKIEFLEYCQSVDRAVNDLLHEEKAPLILAGLGYLLPIYKEANHYPYLAREEISGNPDDLSVMELHRAAWEIVEDYFRKELQEVLEWYHYQKTNTSSDLEVIVPASFHGRIEALFKAADLHRWGRFDPETEEVVLHEREEPGDEDLLDFAAVHCLLKGGSVYTVAPEKVPEGSSAAAILRY
jgi:hypothetical protein